MIYDSDLARHMTCADLLDIDIPAVTADTDISVLLKLFHWHNLSAIPVVENFQSNRLGGIVEQRDVLRALYDKPAGSG